jgi:hypothetical protein
MSARRRAKVVPLPTPPAQGPRINHDLLDEARKDAVVLLGARRDSVRRGHVHARG